MLPTFAVAVDRVCRPLSLPLELAAPASAVVGTFWCHDFCHGLSFPFLRLHVVGVVFALNYFYDERFLPRSSALNW